MSAKPHPNGPAKEVIAPPHLSLRKEVGRPAGPPPLEYGEVRLWLVAKDSRALFAYWEFRPEEHPEARDAEGRSRFYLQILRDDGAITESTQEIEAAAGQCTAAAAESDTLYQAELGFYNEQGIWCFLARSGAARTPPSELEKAPGREKTHLANAPSSTPMEPWSTGQESRLEALLKDEVARKASPAP